MSKYITRFLFKHGLRLRKGRLERCVGYEINRFFADNECHECKSPVWEALSFMDAAKIILNDTLPREER